MVHHNGGCHCGRLRFEVIAPPRISVSECNEGTVEALTVEPCNGREWESQFPEGRGVLREVQDSPAEFAGQIPTVL